MPGTHVGDLSYNKIGLEKENYECLAKTNFERKLNFLKMFPWLSNQAKAYFYDAMKPSPWWGRTLTCGAFAGLLCHVH